MDEHLGRGGGRQEGGGGRDHREGMGLTSWSFLQFNTSHPFQRYVFKGLRCQRWKGFFIIFLGQRLKVDWCMSRFRVKRESIFLYKLCSFSKGILDSGLVTKKVLQVKCTDILLGVNVSQCESKSLMYFGYFAPSLQFFLAGSGPNMMPSE